MALHVLYVRVTAAFGWKSVFALSDPVLDVSFWVPCSVERSETRTLQ
jgi:hypothetical protein